MVAVIIVLGIALFFSLCFNIVLAALYGDYRTRLAVALISIGKSRKRLEDLLKANHADLDLPN